MFAAAAHEADGPRSALQVANEGSGNALLRHALGFLFLSANLNERGAKAPDPRLSRDLRVLVGVYIRDMDLRREIRVFVEQILALTEARALIEVGDGRRL